MHPDDLESLTALMNARPLSRTVMSSDPKSENHKQVCRVDRLDLTRFASKITLWPPLTELFQGDTVGKVFLGQLAVRQQPLAAWSTSWTEIRQQCKSLYSRAKRTQPM